LFGELSVFLAALCVEISHAKLHAENAEIFAETGEKD